MRERKIPYFTSEGLTVDFSLPLLFKHEGETLQQDKIQLKDTPLHLKDKDQVNLTCNFKIELAN